MPELRSLRSANEVQTAVEFGGETVTVVFDRNRITTNWTTRLRRALDGEYPAAAAEALAEVLVAWDVTDGSQPVSPSVDVLADLPSAFLGEVFNAIGEAATPSSAEGNASANISSTGNTDSSPTLATHQNGPTPSLSPPLSTSPSTR